MLFTQSLHKYSATKAYTFVTNICDALAWLPVTRLARRILRWPQASLEIILLALLHLKVPEIILLVQGEVEGSKLGHSVAIYSFKDRNVTEVKHVPKLVNATP